ncbi:hypothetical protein ACTXT7_011256 [Hymenolepis weldensis]
MNVKQHVCKLRRQKEHTALLPLLELLNRLPKTKFLKSITKAEDQINNDNGLIFPGRISRMPCSVQQHPNKSKVRSVNRSKQSVRMDDRCKEPAKMGFNSPVSRSKKTAANILEKFIGN